MCRVGWDETPHHKTVLLVLGILSTDTTYYLYHLLLFKFLQDKRHTKGVQSHTEIFS